jgi:hypothetical protein
VGGYWVSDEAVDAIGAVVVDNWSVAPRGRALIELPPA